MSEARRERIKKANQLISEIASCGRKFFNYTGKGIGPEISCFIELNGRVYWHDGWSLKKVWHRAGWWLRGFTEGGTLNQLTMAIRDWIMGRGNLRYGYFADPFTQENMWGYPKEDMVRIGELAVELGIAVKREGEKP